MNGARGVRISAARQKNDPSRYSCGIYEALTDGKCKNKEGNGYREVFQDGTTAFREVAWKSLRACKISGILIILIMVKDKA